MKKEMKKEEFKINCRNLWIIVYHSHPIDLIPKQHTFRSEYLKNMDKFMVFRRKITLLTPLVWKCTNKK